MECVGCTTALAVVSGYCQSCSDTAEAWSIERAERLERAVAGLEAAERKGWTVTTPVGLAPPDHLVDQAQVLIYPAKDCGYINPAESKAIWAFVAHLTDEDPMPRIMAKRGAGRGWRKDLDDAHLWEWDGR